MREIEPPEPISEREHRRRWSALRQLSAALRRRRVRSRLFGQTELCLKRAVRVDYRRRHDPFLDVAVHAEEPEVQVRVRGELFTWAGRDGRTVAVPTGEAVAAAEAVIASVAGRTAPR